MLQRLIAFFADRHILTNLVFMVVLVGGVFAWNVTSKEELPDITFNFVRVSVGYPGASAEDVEYFITREIEERLTGLDGVHQISSDSSAGQASVRIELEQDLDDVDAVVTEIRNEVLAVDYPDEVLDDPNVRVFKTSKKAILDIALYDTSHRMLDEPSRSALQEVVYALENQLIALPQIHSVNRNGYRQRELHIDIHPDKLTQYEIPFNTVMQEVRANHVRRPAGSLESEREPRVTLLSELDTVEELQALAVQGGFEGKVVRLGEIADVYKGFEDRDNILKVNGHEAVMFSVVKNSSYGILEALDAVHRKLAQFEANNLEGSSLRIALLDDESIDLRNRLRLVSINGSIGFVLILLSLFVFLNRSAGFWVAMGLPFTFCFTMLMAALLGHTINGMTLAAVIIVMGIVVDDAIVVAENITRMIHQGVPRREAIVRGTAYVSLPITASIVTTCIAFVPMMFFAGRFGHFIDVMPPIIFLMLGASLIESLFILPGHMGLRIGRKEETGASAHWFDRVETRYGKALEWALRHRLLHLAVFMALLMLSGYLVTNHMKYVMLPREETRDLVLSGKVKGETSRLQTAKKAAAIEDEVLPLVGREVVGFRTRVSESQRGRATQANEFNMLIEIVPSDQRERSADDIIKELMGRFKKLEGFEDLRFRKSRWGQESGSAIEIIVQENNDDRRAMLLQLLKERMENHPALKDVEVEAGLRIPEYRIDLQREKLKRLAIAPGDVSSTLRAALSGSVLYEYPDGEEDVRVRFSVVDEAKQDIDTILGLPVENRQNYLVKLGSIVTWEEIESPNVITRLDARRTAYVYAGLNPAAGMTPLEIAADLEEDIFPELLSKVPTANLSFGGEVLDTRESSRDFANAVIMVVLLIYAVMAILFNSLVRPLLIMLAIPFGLVGVIFAFYLHGKDIYGFYACVGALGLSGVVINDAIIMLVKLEDEVKAELRGPELLKAIAGVAKTRLRAVLLTTLTTVAGVLPTAYGWAGYDNMLAEMMLALAWGLVFGTVIVLVLVPLFYSLERQFRNRRAS